MGVLGFITIGHMRFGVLTIVVILLLVLLIRTLWQMNESGNGHVYYKTYRLNAFILLIAVIGVGFFEVNYHVKTQQLSGIVQEITGDPDVYVRCQRVADTFIDGEVGTLGYVAWDKPDEALLKWRTCQHLQKFMIGDKSLPTPDQITAIHILTHETRHQLGTKNEAKAECEAIQRDYGTAIALGATPEEASNIVRYYYENMYPHMPPNYVHTDCVEDGPWDESPNDNAFPMDREGIIIIGPTVDGAEVP